MLVRGHCLRTMPVVNITLTKRMERWLKRFVKEKGFHSRSEFLRRR